MLLLAADLLAAATFIPLLSGLYSECLGEFGASLLGLASGAVAFLGFRVPLLAVGLGRILPELSYFVVFLAAVVVSGGLTVLTANTGEKFDLDSLSRTVRRFDDPSTETDGGIHRPSNATGRNTDDSDYWPARVRGARVGFARAGRRYLQLRTLRHRPRTRCGLTSLKHRLPETSWSEGMNTPE